MPILKDAKKAGQPNPLNEAEKKYIRKMSKYMSAVEIGKSLHRDFQLIYTFCRQEKITPANKKNSRGAKHAPSTGFFDETEYAKNNII